MTAAAIDTEYAKITGKENERPSEALDMKINLKLKSAILSLAVVVKVNEHWVTPVADWMSFRSCANSKVWYPVSIFPAINTALGRTGCLTATT